MRYYGIIYVLYGIIIVIVLRNIRRIAYRISRVAECSFSMHVHQALLSRNNEI